MRVPGGLSCGDTAGQATARACNWEISRACDFEAAVTFNVNQVTQACNVYSQNHFGLHKQSA